jgi:hypothetical protein
MKKQTIKLNIWTLTNNKGQLEMEVYRKPTTTDVTINNNSCQPREHKMAAYKSWLYRLCILPLDEKNIRRELDTITKIATNNGYRKEDITKLYNRVKIRTLKNNKADERKNNQKWITFTYTGNYIRKITKLFKNTNIKIAFRTNNTIDKILNNNNNNKINKYDKSGIYKLTCQTCQKVYIGQTGRTLHTRYKEHIRNIRLNKDETSYAQHVLN